MEESKVMVGGTVTYEISGKKLVLKPMSVGKMKKAMLALRESDDALDNVLAHLEVVFSNSENEGVTKEWLSENITMPMANKMIDDMRAVNGMGGRDFLASRGELKEKDLQEKSHAPEIPSA